MSDEEVEDAPSNQDNDASSTENPENLRLEDIRIPPATVPACKVDTEGPRMIITHIDNENFKSYAGRRVLGPFHKCFNAIIGPNGSGKSNVIDSMLFVFGYRASKIRSKKLSVLLHSSDKGGKAQSCTVAVHFVQIVDKDGDSYEIVPNSSITIARTAFRDNSSYYSLNGKRVQFRAIALLLRQHGVDIDHNRFLILQGEVEQIAMMKPKGPSEHETGMLEFIEDIVGTNRFKEPLDKLHTIVDKLSEERTEKMNRLKIVEKEKKALEKPVAEAIEYLELENNVCEKRNLMYQKYTHDLEKVIQTDQEKKTKIEEDLASIVAKLTEIETEEAEYNKEVEVLNKNLLEINKQREKLKEQFDAINTAHTGLQTEIAQKSKQRKKNKEQLTEEKKKLVELEAIPERNQKMIDELKIREERLKGDKVKAEKERDAVVASIQTETQALQDQKETLETTLLNRQKEISELKDRFQVAQSALDIYLSTEQKEKSILETIKSNLDQYTTTLQEREEELKILKVEVPEKAAKLQAIRNELKKVQGEEAENSTRLREVRSKVEESKHALQATRSQGRVLEFIMHQKQRGEIPGIVGRLGDLGAIDPKYDVAISTACGPLDNIVVDRVETAQACIRALREHDIGRATFIALDKQEHLRSQAEGRVTTPDNVPRLYDLIKFKDNSVKTAFYYGLRDTLVANDLTQATRIAYGSRRWRVVTLEGHIIETSGTMSGGGRMKMQGRMGSKIASQSVTPQEQEHMEQQYQSLQAKVVQLRQRMTALQEEVLHLDSTLPQLEMKLKKGNVEIQSLKNQIPVLKEQMKQQQRKVEEAEPDANETKKLTKVRDAAQAEYSKAEEQKQEIEKDVKKIHNKIMEITKGRVAKAQKVVDDLTKDLQKTRKDCTTLSVAIKTATRNKKVCEDKIQSLETEVEEGAQKIVALQEQKEKSEENGRVILVEMNDLAAQVMEKETEIVNMKQKLPDVSEQKVKLRSQKLEKEQKLEKLLKSLEDHENEILSNRRKINAMKLHEIPNKPPAVLKIYTPEEILAVDFGRIQYELSLHEQSLSEKSPNLAVLKEHQEKCDLFIKRSSELDEVNQKRNKARQFLEEVRQQRLSEFLDGYSIITHKLKEMYQMLTLGGDAELELVDSLDPFSEGIVFSVRPPKKSWKNISNLSGGEKTLSSLALVFALHYYKPSPLFVMDEIDAALDFKNVSIVGNYIKERTKNAQFIIISLRSNMFELADHLIGIYKTWDCTKTVAIKPKSYGRKSNQDRECVEADR